MMKLFLDEVGLEQLATGFGFTEGPIWHAGERHLTFSDIPADTMYRWSEADGLAVFRQPSGKANGNAYDRQGRIVTCEHLTSRVSRLLADGSGYEVLAAHYQGKELNSPNDVVVKSDGSIYFTDPPYGRINPLVGLVRPQELDFQGVYRLDAETGALTLLVADFERPNGLCFAAGERRLFINDSARNHIRVFDLLADETLANGRVWAQLSTEGVGVADGMKIDRTGRLWCAGPGGIHVFDPAARFLGLIPMPEQTANFCFGGDDGRSLFITASSSLYRLPLHAPMEA